MDTFVSDLSGKQFPRADAVSAKAITSPILELIKKDNPKFDHHCRLSIGELNFYRQKFVSEAFTKEVGELDDLEKAVINSMDSQTSLTSKLEETTERLTFGQRVADKVAEFGGSWTFILSFLGFLGIWILINIFWLSNKGFDPFPFILLNLILSCVAALQAPIIMMSQNRQEEKDRSRAKKDYMINLKSELEIRLLHEKLDHLIIRQQQELLEVQKEQIDMMNDILKRLGESK